MSLSNAAVVTGPSSIAPTGGTALTFTSAGVTKSGSLELYVAADTDLRLRRTITASVKTPTVNAGSPNGYTQARASLIFRKPKLLDNGKITVNTARIEFAYDPETTQTEIQELADVAAQMCFDADFLPTIKALSLS